VHVTGAICQRSSRWAAYEKYLKKENEIPNAFSVNFGGGSLMDFGCYAAYAAVALFGEPTSVTYTPAMLDHANAIDGAGTLVLRYAPTGPDQAKPPRCKETVCTFVLSKVSDGRSELQVQTDKRTFTASGLMDFLKVTMKEHGSQSEVVVDEIDKSSTVTERKGGKESAFVNIMHFELNEFLQWVQVAKKKDDIGRARDLADRVLDRPTHPGSLKNSLIVASVLDRARDSSGVRRLMWH